MSENGVEGPDVVGRPLPILPAHLAKEAAPGPLAVVVHDRETLGDWLSAENPELQWIEVRGLLGDEEIWREAARSGSEVPLDVVVADPATQFAQLYRLVDVREVRPVRVTIPVQAGFLKALRLAVSLRLPVRLLPGQPEGDALAELEEAVDFYLHDPMVEVPIEYFHSTLASLHAEEPGSLWRALEVDPAVYLRHGEGGLPEDAGADRVGEVREHPAEGARTEECESCRWLGFCRGYFKQPDPEYSCDGVLRIFDRLGRAAEEMREDLATAGTAPETETMQPERP